MQLYNLDVAGANWFMVEADTYALYTLIRRKLAAPAEACQRMFPDIQTYGPVVVCEKPTPAQPKIRPITSGATCGKKWSMVLPLQLIIWTISCYIFTVS